MQSQAPLGIPRLDQREQHFFIAGPKNNLRLFLRLLTSETLLAGGRRAVLYVHGATFPSALSIAHRGYVLANGRVVLEGSASTLQQNELVKKAFIGA